MCVCVCVCVCVSVHVCLCVCGWVCVCFCGWVVGWLGVWVCGWVGGWMGGSVCGESSASVVFVRFLSAWDVRCILVIFQCLELTLVSAGTHVCDCGVICRLMVLGEQQPGTGARVLHGRREGWGKRSLSVRKLRICDVVVTLFDLRRLETAVTRVLDSFLLLCRG